MGDLKRADERLHHALKRARAVNVVEFELPALIAIAELEMRHGNLANAEARLAEIWEAAERRPYPIHQADAYNVLADIERTNGDQKAAMEAATKAYQASWCDGPPYTYHWGMEKGKAHLNVLGAPEPEMPAFDESQFDPLPEVEINPRMSIGWTRLRRSTPSAITLGVLLLGSTKVSGHTVCLFPF